MEERKRTDGTHVFSVRIWHEELGAGAQEWRGRVHDAESGENRYFRDWDTLLTFFQHALQSDQPTHRMCDR